jgi:hypothetical protein
MNNKQLKHNVKQKSGNRRKRKELKKPLTLP